MGRGRIWEVKLLGPLAIGSIVLIALSGLEIRIRFPISLEETAADGENEVPMGEGSGARWARYHPDLKPYGDYDSGSTYNGVLSSRFGTRLNPYADYSYVTERGLPDMDVRYEAADGANPYSSNPIKPYVGGAGSKPIFSADQASRDLDALNEFGMVKKQDYLSKSKDIQAAETHPFGANVLFRDKDASTKINLNDPKGWTGETKMCRDVTTHMNGLSNEGWSQMSTLKCCSYLCSHSQWSTYRDGSLLWSQGPRNRYSTAVETGTTAKMADGSERYLCKTCAWDYEPSWSELGFDKLPKMEGHLSAN